MFLFLVSDISNSVPSASAIPVPHQEGLNVVVQSELPVRSSYSLEHVLYEGNRVLCPTPALPLDSSEIWTTGGNVMAQSCKLYSLFNAWTNPLADQRTTNSPSNFFSTPVATMPQILPSHLQSFSSWTGFIPGVVHQAQKVDSRAFPWMLGILLSALLGSFILIAILCWKKRLQTRSRTLGDPYRPFGRMLSSASSRKLVGHHLAGDNVESNQFKLPTIPSQHLYYCSFGQPVHPSSRQRNPYELRIAHFPTKSQLGNFVFPPAAKANGREIVVSRQESPPSAPSSCLASVPSFFQPVSPSTLDYKSLSILTATRPLNLAVKSGPLLFTNRPPPEQKKRVSPIGDVLYSTSGEGKPLETLGEKLKESIADPKAENHCDVLNATRSEQEPNPSPASTSCNDFSPSPARLRARRQSSLLMSSFDIALTLHKLTSGKSKLTRSPVMGRMCSGSVGRQRSDAAARIGQLDASATECVMSSPKSSAAEEEHKFKEFVENLVKGMQKRDAKRQGLSTPREDHAASPSVEKEATVLYDSKNAVDHKNQDSPSCYSQAIDNDNKDLGDLHRGKGTDSTVGLSIFLPPLSCGASLSDFSSADSLSSDILHASGSTFSIGAAI